MSTTTRDVLTSILGPTFKTRKAAYFIQSHAQKRPGRNTQTILLLAYLAEKYSLNNFHRPLFGATYRAERIGPIPVEISQLIRGVRPYAHQIEGELLPWQIDGTKIYPSTTTTLNGNGILDNNDIESIETSYRSVQHIVFNQSTPITHAADWRNARGNIISYEDMLIGNPKYEEIASKLKAQ